MRFQTLGNKPGFVSERVKSAEASATIGAGRPVILDLSATEDGLRVVLPSSSTAAKIAQFSFGIVMKDLLPGQLGEAQQSGIFNTAIIAVATRAASTDAFASLAAGSIGQILTINTTHNVLGVSATTSVLGPGYFLAQTFASTASSSIVSTGTNLVATTTAKVFIRLL
jgi:hypothetical protein